MKYEILRETSRLLIIAITERLVGEPTYRVKFRPAKVFCLFCVFIFFLVLFRRCCARDTVENDHTVYDVTGSRAAVFTTRNVIINTERTRRTADIKSVIIKHPILPPILS